MSKPFVIIGINAYHADASAAVFVNGELVAAIEEERLNRVKHWAGFPEESIVFCLQEAGISFADVDVWAIGRDTKAKLAAKLSYLLTNGAGSLQGLQQRLKNRGKIAGLPEQLAIISGLPTSHFKNKIASVEHHRSHLASAFFASPFKEAACLSIDGSGDFSTTMTAMGKHNTLDVLQSVNFPHSLGFFYTAFTQLLGFPHYGDEYKVMGMAPYGSPKYAAELQKLVTCTADGLFSLDLSYFTRGMSGIVSYGENHVPVVASLFTEKLAVQFGPVREQDAPITQYHKDLAASVQQVTEQVLFHILNHLHTKTGSTNVCIAGGVAQNSVANGKITRNTPFKNVYIPPAGHDAGIAMGAALYVQHQQKNMHRFHMSSACTGSKFTNEEIAAALEAQNIVYDTLPDEELYNIVTDCLINGGVVGWMTGRSEFGPRALGGRSILVDPRRTDAKEILNTKIKRRESFRPFAPSILEPFVTAYFELNEPVPFMEKVFPIKPEKQVLIPAVTHVDGSGRLQVVNKQTSPRYYALIENFYNKTGIPILVNTSFNENEPIVNTPQQALDCYLRNDMDMLVMENIVVRRQR